jgi:hypothetical protein
MNKHELHEWRERIKYVSMDAMRLVCRQLRI